ncbi:twitching motility protein PilT [Natranaerovirga pectinivora]|uniref:Twitching motility protein PilT n=1 Tax=Natranaerovirga pectinivora TaxID=682400 RepID=A0A4R3MQU0_9FIRM|nr:type IV pilus twitching motility protein PilT [Natranaerovirga pectinivora]TCT16893.1 twitching motility protein PilT [Natranaerovirga pectinivora]
MYTVEELLIIAKENKASDLHLTVGRPPTIRINGNLKYAHSEKLSPQTTQELIMSILTEKQKDVLEQKGEVDFSFSYTNIGRFRANVFRQRGSYGAAIRLVGTTIPSPSALGIPKTVVDLYNKRRGLILVTGPTGSGKSTTLASIIDKINTNCNAHIITLEDPIEYLHSHQKSIVNQREIGLDTQSYANALRAALRQDPDVILVGEMRDLETISIAITAAETGHLVLSTLHTIGAASTIDRIIDVFPPHQQQQIRVQLSTVLESIVSQQLLPTVDEKGRVAAFEVLHANAAVRNLIREGKTHQIESIIQTNKSIGMTTMDDALYDLYLNGYITSEKALLYAQNPISLKRKLV